MTKGDIVLLKLPLGDSHEQSGLRPAIVMSEEVAKILVIIPLTTKASALKYPFTINIKSSKLNGLNEDSIALIFQLRAIDKKRINNKLGELEKNLLSKIDNLLNKLLNIK